MFNPTEYKTHIFGTFNKCLCIGDSLTEGVFNHKLYNNKYTSVISKYSYPTQLANLSNLEVTNLGHSGYTSVNWWNEEQNTDLSGMMLRLLC